MHGILKDLLTEVRLPPSTSLVHSLTTQPTLCSKKSSHSVELVITFLIAVEVVLAFWTHWEELRAAVGLPSTGGLPSRAVATEATA